MKGLLVSSTNAPTMETAWLETENRELGKLITSKVMTSKYFASEYSKFEEQDKNYNLKKNFKERSRLLNNAFGLAFEFATEFETNSNSRKYITVALDHLDERNPGLCINALTLLTRALEVFPALIEDCLPSLLEKLLPLLDLKKVEMGQLVLRFLNKLY
jgi:hypothetical protein